MGLWVNYLLLDKGEGSGTAHPAQNHSLCPTQALVLVALDYGALLEPRLAWGTWLRIPAKQEGMQQCLSGSVASEEQCSVLLLPWISYLKPQKSENS